MVGKHAYLIMCHTNINQLCILLDLLDDKRNDIFLHIDKKTRNYSIENLKTHSVYSRLFFVKPMYVNWGGSSQIKLEIKLLKEASKTPYDYYHLISGMDLPIKTQDEIHSFFSKNFGHDYISLGLKYSDYISGKNMDLNYFYNRLNYYYLFQNCITRGKNRWLSKWQWYSIRIQRKLNINRIRNASIEFYKGFNWFSITHSTACYVLNEYYKLKKYFRYTFCADEIFLQTIMMNSINTNKINDNDLRYIDWVRGNPYTFKIADYNTLMNTNKLFARKFDINIDEKIVYKIRDTLLSKEHEI